MKNTNSYDLPHYAPFHEFCAQNLQKYIIYTPDRKTYVQDLEK
jgi:hypothetical protein